MMQLVNTASHHDIPSYWLDRAGVCTGTLTFAVGCRNEPPTMAGITHLVEHLVLRLAQPVPNIHGGTVKVDSVEFFSSGDPRAVANFLNTIASVISGFASVTEEDLALEKLVIEAEDPRAFHAVSGGLLTYRFGASGVGAAQFGAPATSGFTRTEVLEWAKRWLTVENAALTFIGRLPELLDVRLPSGGIVGREQSSPVVTTPRLIESTKGGVALSFSVPLQQAGLLGEALRFELLSRLRHARGLIYSVEVFTTQIDGAWCQLDLILDPIEKNVVAALRASVDAVRDVAANGFSETAVQSAQSVRVTELGWEHPAASEYLDRLAIDGLLGRVTPSREALLDQAVSLSSLELTTALGESLASLIVACDRDVNLSKPDVKALAMTIDRYDIWQQHDGKKGRHRHEYGEGAIGYRKWRSRSSNAALWLTKSHLLKRESGEKSSIRLADVVVVGDRSCGCISLMDRWGRSLELDVDQWRGGKKLRRRLLKAFPVEIVRAFPEE